MTIKRTAIEIYRDLIARHGVIDSGSDGRAFRQCIDTEVPIPLIPDYLMPGGRIRQLSEEDRETLMTLTSEEVAKERIR